MMNRIWQGLAAVAGVAVAILYALFQRAKRGEEKARRNAEIQKRNAQTAALQRDERREQDEVLRTIQEQGHVEVEELRKRATDGKRDHFTAGVRDDKD